MLAKYLVSAHRHALFATKATASGFATAAKANYYNVLEVASSATEEAIRNAYSDLTREVHPDTHPSQFKKLNEAFVILVDGKSRDAYDSLLKVRKQYYLSDEAPQEIQEKGYWAQRKEQKLRELQKKLNIDEFGRYKGGLPNKRGNARGNARRSPGETHTAVQIQEQLDSFPEFPNVTQQKAESFKNYHQDERQARTMKWPWFTSKVDYDYFSFRTLRTQVWSKIQFFVFIMYIVPNIAFFFQGHQRLAEQKKIQERQAQKLKDAELAKAKQAQQAMTQGAVPVVAAEGNA